MQSVIGEYYKTRFYAKLPMEYICPSLQTGSCIFPAVSCTAAFILYIPAVSCMFWHCSASFSLHILNVSTCTHCVVSLHSLIC